MGETKAMPGIMGVFGYDINPVRRVMIGGAGPISRHLARHLAHDKVMVKLIELKKPKADRTAEQLDRVMVLHGDVTDSDLLESENVGDMDAFVAATNDEETNLMSCLLTRHLGVPKTIALMHRANYIPLVHALGIDAAISVRLNTASAIMKFVRRGNILSFAQLKESEAEALELVAHDGTVPVGRRIRDLGLPDHAIIGAIIRGNDVLIPRGDTKIEAEDRVVVFALPKAVDSLVQLFS
jgi:trk system potassium uptake protein TrkA